MTKHDDAMRVWTFLCERYPDNAFTLHRHCHGDYSISWHAHSLSGVENLLEEIGFDMRECRDCGGIEGENLVVCKAVRAKLRLDVLYTHKHGAALPAWFADAMEGEAA